MLRPITFLVVTLSLIGTLQLFDQVALFGSAAASRVARVTRLLCLFKRLS